MMCVLKFSQFSEFFEILSVFYGQNSVKILINPYTLRNSSASAVWISSHPDVVAKRLAR